MLKLPISRGPYRLAPPPHAEIGSAGGHAPLRHANITTNSEIEIETETETEEIDNILPARAAHPVHRVEAPQPVPEAAAVDPTASTPNPPTPRPMAPTGMGKPQTQWPWP